MCKGHFQAELNLSLRHHEPIYMVLRDLQEIDHKNHMKRLKDVHDTETIDINKNMELQRKQEVKTLTKSSKDKEELSR